MKHGFHVRIIGLLKVLQFAHDQTSSVLLVQLTFRRLKHNQSQLHVLHSGSKGVHHCIDDPSYLIHVPSHFELHVPFELSLGNHQHVDIITCCNGKLRMLEFIACFFNPCDTFLERTIHTKVVSGKVKTTHTHAHAHSPFLVFSASPSGGSFSSLLFRLLGPVVDVSL